MRKIIELDISRREDLIDITAQVAGVLRVRWAADETNNRLHIAARRTVTPASETVPRCRRTVSVCLLMCFH